MKFSDRNIKEIAFLNQDKVMTYVGRDLLAKMVDRADSCPAYDHDLDSWMREGKTIRLRELALPWGKYFSDLNHSNAIDQIDSAHLHLMQAQAPGSQPEAKRAG